ncbi:LysR family transcriptional regulator, partial [Enterococcus faecium]|uniref:LysR substrate-binding domain-containing protein n=1 Tax=Enterococcus faecium TaxID=1352 RepID=UPI001133B9A8
VDILPQQCLMYSLAGSQTWRFQRQEQQQDIVLNAGRYTVNNSLALAQTAVLGHGLALLPLHLIRRELADGSLVQVLPEWQVEDHALYI